MRKVFKYLAWLFAGLAVVFSIALVVLLNIDFNNYKTAIEERVQAATGRSLAIGGRLDVDLGFTTRVAVGDVRFGNAPGGSRDTMLELGRLEVDVDLLSLLTDTPYVRRFLLRDLDLLVENDATGRSNLEFTPPPPADAAAGTAAADPAPARSRPSGSPVLPVVREADISNLRIAYKATPKAAEQRLEIASLTVRGGDSGKEPVKIALSGNADGAPLALRGETGSWEDLKNPAQPWPVALNGDLAGLKLAVNGGIARPLQGRGIDITVTAETAEIGGLSRITLPLAGTRVPALGPLRLALALSGDAGRDLSLRDLDLQLGNGQPLSLSVTGAVTLQERLPVPDLNIVFETPDLSGLSRAAGTPLPPLRPLTAALHIGGDGQGLFTASDIALTFGRNSLTGGASLDMRGRPALDLSLAGKTLLLDDLLQALGGASGGAGTGKTAGGGASGAQKAAPARLIPGAPLDLAGLRLADARISLALDRLQRGQGFLAPVRLTAALKDGVLTLPEFSMTDGGGGALTARLELDARRAETGLKAGVTATAMGAANLMRLAGQPGLLEGPLMFDTSLAATGGSPRALAAALDGHVRLKMLDGQLNVNEIRRLAGDAATTGLALLFGNATAGKTPLYCMVADYGVVKGVATARTLVLDAGSSTVTGVGGVDLNTEKLDITVIPHGLLGGAVPLVVRGTLAAPEAGPGRVSLGKLLPGLGGGGAMAHVGDPALTAADSPCVNLRPGSQRGLAAPVGEAAGKAMEKTGKALGGFLKKVTGQ